MGFADAFDMAYIMKRDIEELIKFNILVSMPSYNHPLFKVLTKSITTREE